MLIRIWAPASAACAGRTLLPDVLAHRQPDAHTPMLEDTGGRPGLEVALLVEDPVIGQMLLGVLRHQGPVTDHPGDVVQPPEARLRVAQDQGDAADLGAEPGQRRLAAPDQLRAQQQILRRIAGEGQLRKDHQIGPQLVTGNAGSGEHLVQIAGHVADQQIQLGDQDAQLHGWLQRYRAVRKGQVGDGPSKTKAAQSDAGSA